MQEFHDYILKNPILKVWDFFVDKIKSGFADIAADYITAFPIMVGVSIAVYALVSMFSSKLAKLGVVGVFAYGALVVIA
ncbi:hypothetical protein ACFSMW_06510 [Virgibacillus halophilus]|uniref:hypothetical protein n=1 Tax=Tigheibacillus halophilus TaxID=361280 RepID=UPI00363327DB